MKIQHVCLLASLLLLTVVLAACGSPEPNEPASAETSASEGTGVDAGATTYEPAYPAEVSAEGLTEEDIAQQEATHSHGDGEEHAHGDEGDHAHGEGDEHAHEGGEEHAHDDAGDHGEDHEHDGEDPPHAH